MKRRDFLSVTLGAAAISPLVSVAEVGTDFQIGAAPDLIHIPVGEGGRWFMDQPTRIGWFTLRYSDAQQSAVDFVKQAEDAKMNLICLLK